MQENPYKKYVSLDNLAVTSVFQKEEAKRDLTAAPTTLGPDGDQSLVGSTGNKRAKSSLTELFLHTASCGTHRVWLQARVGSCARIQSSERLARSAHGGRHHLGFRRCAGVHPHCPFYQIPSCRRVTRYPSWYAYL